jgi:Ser/Thr protein kinase RdoA (MazF antagonist)
MSGHEHRVHGLAADDAAPDWPPLARAELDALARAYPQLGGMDAIAWHSPRPLSAAALVRSAAGEVFVKRHHRRVRTPATLAEEHRFIAHLRAAGAPVPAVLRNAEGGTATALGAWTYEVHERAAGIDLYRDTASWTPLRDRHHALVAGEALARLHHAAEGYAAPQRDTHILVARCDLLAAADPVAALAAQLPERPGLAGYLAARDWQADLRAVLGRFHATAQPHLAAEPRLWTHGDWHVSNLCWLGEGAGARVSAVLDFGLAAPTFALFDLATAIERNAIAWLELERGGDAVHVDIALALIEGYRRRRPLAAEQVRLLADLLPRVHVDFALSEVEYFHGITGSEANADIAYDVFLRGHAAWFETAPGQALLEAIRNSALGH